MSGQNVVPLRSMFEHYQLKAKSFCQHYQTVYQYQSSMGLALRRAKINCGSWYCPRCAKRQKKKLQARLFNFFKREGIIFMTLTTRNYGQDPAEELINMGPHWMKLHKRMFRKYGKINYFRIIEFHDNGQPHMHVLLDKYIDQDWLSAQWENIHGAPVVDVRYKSKQHGVYYASKYVTKGLADDDFRYSLFSVIGIRRYSFSQGSLNLFEKTDTTSLTPLVDEFDATTLFYAARRALYKNVGVQALFHIFEEDYEEIIILAD